MPSQSTCPNALSDRDLLTELEHAATCERAATAHLIALLIEVDSRKLYAGQGCSSLFTYCVQVLHFSEHAAYLRIEAARSARRFPVILQRLSDGSLHLTAISLLGPHLTAANHVELLDSAKHMRKRDVELLVARVRPQPDVPPNVRKLPVSKPLPVPASTLPVPVLEVPILHTSPRDERPPQSPPSSVSVPNAARASEIKPLAPERYKLQCTVSRETYDKLRTVQDMLRHTIPAGDLAAILDRALTLLLAEVSRTKFAATDRPQRDRSCGLHSRHIPASIKRIVWARDGARCAFQGKQGRCIETGFLEFHHLVPYADGGETSATNLELRCRAHNQYEADLWSAAAQLPLAKEERAVFGL